MRARWIVAALIFAAFPALGHDQYQDWKMPDTGQSCCHGVENGGDCRPTVGYIGDDGLWRAKVGPKPDDFAIVPPSKLLPRSPDGRCHVCARHFIVYCFAPCDVRG